MATFLGPIRPNKARSGSGRVISYRVKMATVDSIGALTYETMPEAQEARANLLLLDDTYSVTSEALFDAIAGAILSAFRKGQNSPKEASPDSLGDTSNSGGETALQSGEQDDDNSPKMGAHAAKPHDPHTASVEDDQGEGETAYGQEDQDQEDQEDP